MEQFGPVIWPLAVVTVIGLWHALGKGIRWISREVAENVVEAIGDTLSARWKADMDRALTPIYAELKDNGGASLKDKVKSIDQRLGDIEQQLEHEITFKPDRRFGDDIGGTPI